MSWTHHHAGDDGRDPMGHYEEERRRLDDTVAPKEETKRKIAKRDLILTQDAPEAFVSPPPPLPPSGSAPGKNSIRRFSAEALYRDLT